MLVSLHEYLDGFRKMIIIVTVKSPAERSSEDNMIIFHGAIYHSTMQIE